MLSRVVFDYNYVVKQLEMFLRFHCLYSVDYGTRVQWLMPPAVGTAHELSQYMIIASLIQLQ